MLRKCHFGATVNVDIVVTIAEHACDHVLKRVLKLSAYRLQIFLVTDESLRSLQLCEDQAFTESLKNVCLRSLQLIWIPDCQKMHKTFATVKRKTYLQNLVLSIITIPEKKCINGSTNILLVTTFACG